MAKHCWSPFKAAFVDWFVLIVIKEEVAIKDRHFFFDEFKAWVKIIKL